MSISAPDKRRLCACLWGLCSPIPPEGYTSPWDGEARALYGDLARRVEDHLGAAAAAPCDDYATCARALSAAAPPLFRAMAGIRGLAMSSGAKKPAIVPGEPLVYETLMAA